MISASRLGLLPRQCNRQSPFNRTGRVAPGDDGRYFGYQPLRSRVFPDANPQLLSEPKFELLKDAPRQHPDAIVSYRLFTRDGAGEPQSMPLKDISEATAGTGLPGGRHVL
jgi:hypothetical protein